MLLGKMMRKVFFGQLRAAEMEVNIFLTVLILEKNFYRAFGINWLRVLSNIPELAWHFGILMIGSLLD